MKDHVVDARGVRIHVVEDGEGPLVLLIHGFPESWYSWRYQLPVLARAGYRAAAIDVRGYGRSSAPVETEAYGMLHHVNDNLGVVEALGETTAIVVGHDWGSPIAANSALLRPDVFTAMALLSVPYSPPGRLRPTDSFAAMGGDEEFYINYFQQPGRAEAEIELDVRSWLLGFYITASGEGAAAGDDGGSMATVPRGGMMRDRFRIPEALPPWLGRADLDFYVSEFERTGFSRPPEPLPQRRPRLGGPPTLAGAADHCPLPLHRWREGRPDHLGKPGYRAILLRPSRLSKALIFFPDAVTGCSRNGPAKSTSFCCAG